MAIDIYQANKASEMATAARASGDNRTIDRNTAMGVADRISAFWGNELAKGESVTAIVTHADGSTTTIEAQTMVATLKDQTQIRYPMPTSVKKVGGTKRADNVF